MLKTRVGSLALAAAARTTSTSELASVPKVSPSFAAFTRPVASQSSVRSFGSSETASAAVDASSPLASAVANACSVSSHDASPPLATWVRQKSAAELVCRLSAGTAVACLRNLARSSAIATSLASSLSTKPASGAGATVAAALPPPHIPPPPPPLAFLAASAAAAAHSSTSSCVASAAARSSLTKSAPRSAVGGSIFSSSEM